MKKFLIACLIVVSFATSAFASNNVTISSKAMAHLEANYSAAKNVSWTISDNFEKASFTVGNEKIDVYYNEYGDLLGSTKTMAFDKLPKSALEILTTQYTFPEYELTDCIEYTDADNNKSFFVSFDLNNERIVLSISASGSVAQM
ncbi:MAG TPA: hypothetical protein VHQ04_00970 [Puia sp.]|jgi:hypothetical protein|nr:hypothetical protein [Puia sp.]